MSSPIAEKQKGLIEKSLISIHQRASHNNRVNLLSKLLSDRIEIVSPNKNEIRCIDIGCGDMTIAESIAAINPKTSWTCIDIHKLPEELKNTDKWKKYKQFDGTHIPFENNAFDCALFCDVLHHIPGDLSPLLKEAARVSSAIIIKDHFEYGWYSRTMLKLMDFAGNWSYGISIPEYYFTVQNFEKLCSESGLEISDMKIGVDLYSHLPVFNKILKPQWQFIAVLKRK
jgi:SAM-dependent methyltransferase